MIFEIRKYRMISRTLVLFMMTTILATMHPMPLVAQELKKPKTTNPSFHDTDGDGYLDGKDTWIDMGSVGYFLRAGEDKNGNGKYEPEGEDGILGTEDDESDPNDPSSHPDGDQVLDKDSDKDGLLDSYELRISTYIYDADSDDDGIKDGDEVWGFIDKEGKVLHLPLSAHWARRPTSPLNPDSDGDGLPDGLEMGLTQTGIDPDTGVEYTQPGKNTYNANWFNQINNTHDEWFIGTGQTVPAENMHKYLPKQYNLDVNGEPILQDTFVPVPAGVTPTITDPLSKDSNHNKILDGIEDFDRNGYINGTETDPSVGIVNLPPIEFMNSETHSFLLRTGQWRSIADNDDGSDPQLFVTFKAYDPTDPHPYIKGAFGLNLGVNQNPVNLSLNSTSDVNLNKNGDISLQDTDNVGWTPVELSSNDPGTVDFEILADTGVDISQIAGAGINPWIVDELKKLAPCVDISYTDNRDNAINGFVRNFIFEEIISEIIHLGARLYVGVGAAVPVLIPILLIANVIAQLQFYIKTVGPALKLWISWRTIWVRTMYPYGISFPSFEILGICGTIVKKEPELLPPIGQALTLLYFRNEIYRTFGIPLEWNIFKTVDFGFLDVQGQLAHPIRVVEYKISNNMLNWTRVAAEYHAGYNGVSPADQIIRLVPFGENCIEQLEEGKPYPEAPELKKLSSPTNNSKSRFSTMSSAKEGVIHPIDPILDLKPNTLDNFFQGDIDLLVFGEDGSLTIVETKSIWKSPNRFVESGKTQGSLDRQLAILMMVCQDGMSINKSDQPPTIFRDKYGTDLRYEFNRLKSFEERVNFLREYSKQNAPLNAILDCLSAYRKKIALDSGEDPRLEGFGNTLHKKMLLFDMDAMLDASEDADLKDGGNRITKLAQNLLDKIRIEFRVEAGPPDIKKHPKGLVNLPDNSAEDKSFSSTTEWANESVSSVMKILKRAGMTMKLEKIYENIVRFIHPPSIKFKLGKWYLHL